MAFALGLLIQQGPGALSFTSLTTLLQWLQRSKLVTFYSVISWAYYNQTISNGRYTAYEASKAKQRSWLHQKAQARLV